MREHSHALMSLMDVIKHKDPACFANPDNVLRDQFIEFVEDNMVRHDLRRHPSLSFSDAQQERCVEEGENPGIQRPQAQSCSIANVAELAVHSNAVLVSPLVN